MRTTHERDTKARLSFSGGLHAPVNMAGSMEEVDVGGKTQEMAHLRYAKFSQILEVLRDFHRLFGSRNSPTTGILHTIRHVYRREKLSLAAVSRLYVLCMTVELACSTTIKKISRKYHSSCHT